MTFIHLSAVIPLVIYWSSLYFLWLYLVLLFDSGKVTCYSLDKGDAAGPGRGLIRVEGTKENRDGEDVRLGA